MSPADRWRIRHMIDAGEQALAFVDGRQRADLDCDPMLRPALTRAVDIMGEAAAQIIGMRNRLVHAYFDINPNILWDTVQMALPALLDPLKASLGTE
jgi:uncharacterized protein with HEPN domain